METATLASPTVTELTSVWLARVAPGRDGRGALQLDRTPGCRLPAYAERRGSRAFFAGVLYNRNELAATLVSGDSSVGDAELILCAYERWGRECPNHVRGFFAFVVWDGDQRVAFGARDRVGIYPLFWALTPGGDLMLSSSISSLLSAPDVSSSLNRPAMVDYLRHTWGSHPAETLFQAVSRIPAGHAFELKSGRVDVWAYWDVLREDVEIDWLEDSSVEEFSAKLDQVVGRCVGLGPTGIFLSGGLDSVSVAASAIESARTQNRPAPVALSLGFPHPECNEEDVQRAVASRLNLPQVLLPFEQTVEPDGMLWLGLMLGRGLDAPLSNGWAPAYNQLRAAAQRNGCQIIMTGAGGDDWLCPNPLYIADLIRTLDVSGLTEALRNMLRSYDLPPVALLRRLLWVHGVRPILTANANRVLKAVAPGVLEGHRRRHQEAMTPPWLAPDPELQRESRRRFDEVGARLMKRPAPSGRFAFYLSEGPSGLISPMNAMEMEESFELSRRTQTLELAPYWDPDLVEFLNRIPPKVLDRGGRSKGLVRGAIARRFPELGFERQRKVSALNYFGSILEKEAPRAWDRLGGVASLVELGIVSPEFAEAAPRELANPRGGEVGRIIHRHRILDVMHVEAWVRNRAA